MEKLKVLEWVQPWEGSFFCPWAFNQGTWAKGMYVRSRLASAVQLLASKGQPCLADTLEVAFILFEVITAWVYSAVFHSGSVLDFKILFHFLKQPGEKPHWSQWGHKAHGGTCQVPRHSIHKVSRNHRALWLGLGSAGRSQGDHLGTDVTHAPAALG